MDRNTKRLDGRELKKLGALCELLEREAYLPYKNISGGFSVCELFDYDDEIIDVRLCFGVQGDCENNTHTELLRVDREKMEVL